MFLETSAIVESILEGPRAEDIADRIASSSTGFYVGPTVEFEATVVITSKLQCSVEDARELVGRFVRDVRAERMTITPEIGEQAIAAFARYGKGRGHSAQLNFGDCFAYAMAKAAGVPLLYVGNDFAETDLA